MQPTLIVISGSPASGKTTLAKTLGERYGLIVLHKDGFKETLFDRLGWSDREWSKKMGVASFGVLFHAAEAILRAEHSCVIESNFIAHYDAPHIGRLREMFQAEVIEILCHGDAEQTIKRFTERMRGTERHPGHVESVNLADMEQMIRSWKTEPMDASHTLFHLDTSRDFREQYANLFTQLDPLLIDTVGRKR